MAQKERKRSYQHRPEAAKVVVLQPAPGRHPVGDHEQREISHQLGAGYAGGTAYALSAHAAPDPPPHHDPESLAARDRGEPLPGALRRRLERRFGRNLGAVRIHRGKLATEAAGALEAHAFTHRNHIWLGPGGERGGEALLAHELTHVAQQGHAPRLAPRAAVSLGGGRHAGGGGQGAAAAAPPARSGGGAVQRFDIWGAAKRVGGAVASTVRAGVGAVADVAGNLLSMGRSALLAVVRRIAPDFLPLFEGDGIVGFVRRLIQRGLRSLFDGLMAPLRGFINFGAIGARLSQAVTWISTIAGQLANNDCSGILAAARQVGNFFSRALKPVVDRIKSIADRVSGFFSSIWNAIGAPIMDILRRIGGEIWRSLQGFVRDVGRVIRRVRNALGAAWDRVKRWFGIGAEEGESEGGGLWNWIRDKASSIGSRIARAVRPIIGPLRQAGGVLLLLVPGGQIAAVMLLWPELRRAFSWLTQKWRDLNLIPRASAYLSNTVLPAVINAAEGLAQAFLRGADWLLGLLDRLVGFLAGGARAATGLFAPLGRLIGYARQQFHRIVSWVRSGLRYASRNFRSLVRRLIAFLQPILNALRQLILIAVNPFGIVGFLMGSLWRLLPDCLKGPIIDFILSIIIRVLRAMPPNPLLGFLWPLVKSAMLGFLETVLGFSTQRKVNVSNKIARIISGMSPTFFLGFLRGLALGVWNGITAPFQAIATIFELPSMIQSFLSNLGVRLCELVERIRCFAAELAGRVFGSLDSILSGLQELLSDPARILSLIRCAIEGALGAAQTIGQQIANGLMQILEGPDDSIGERLGELAGNQLVQAVITYFTAGVGAGVGIIQSLSRALSAVGRAIRQVVQLLRGLLGRLVGFVRGLASRFAGAVVRGTRSVLGRLGGFFRRVAAWFGRLFRRLGARLGRRFRLTAAERAQWAQFRVAVRGALAAYPQGVRRNALRTRYRSILSGHRRVAKWPAFITRHNAYFRLWVRRVKSLRPRRVGRVLEDSESRFRRAARVVRRRLRRVRNRDKNVGALNRILQPLRRRFRFTQLEARHDTAEHDFDIIGAMSPRRKIAEVDEEDFATQSEPLPLRYPKRASSRYPVLYFGPRFGSRGSGVSQERLRAAQNSDTRKRALRGLLSPREKTRWDERGREIETYRPHGSKALPGSSRVVGIGGTWRVSRGKLLKLEPSDSGTPGGGRMNRALRPYGFMPSVENMDGDHVVEIQLGGRDIIPNLWPLDASENRSAGSLLSSMSFTKPDGSPISMNELKREARRRRRRGRFVWLRISSTR